jgi:NADH dehydrogenase
MQNIKISGLLAWLAWLAIHLMFLIGFRNKVSVLFHWIYSYTRYRSGARIIVDLGRKEKGK